MALVFKIRKHASYSFLGFKRKHNLNKLNDKLPIDCYLAWDREAAEFVCDRWGNYEIHTSNPDGVDREKLWALVYSHGFWVSLHVDDRGNTLRNEDAI